MSLSFSRQIELVLEEGQKSGTHKFAFIRGIIDYALENDVDMNSALKIPVLHIAINHIRYYWKMHLHEVKQVSAGSLPYYKAIESLCLAYGIDTSDKVEARLYDLINAIYTKRASNRSVAALNKIRKKIIEMPARYAITMQDANLDFYSAPSFVSSIAGKDFEELYKAENAFIEIPKKHIPELVQYRSLLEKVCVLHWASMTDQYTGMVNSGISYLEAPKNRRNSLAKYLRIYKDELGVKNCSYCGANATTIDHVYPWKYAKRDEFWNLLPSCKSCNSKKSDKILPLSSSNLNVLTKFTQHILSVHFEFVFGDIKYRSICDSVSIEEVCKTDYLVRQTVSKVSAARTK